MLDRPAEDWSASELARRWSRGADSLFSVKQEQFIKTLLSKLTISANVRFDGVARRGYVSLRPTQLQAASADGEGFEVRLEVRDAASKGSGWVVLDGCTDGTREEVLDCEMRDFNYRGRTEPAKDRRNELRTLRLKSLGVHLIRHAPASAETGVGGIVEPQ
jgi:hypothetical protein